MNTQKKKIKGRVIIPYGRSLIALMIAQSLGSRGVEIIGCDCVSMTVLTFSKYVQKNMTYRDYMQDEEGFIQDIINIVKENKPDDDIPYFLIPCFNETKIIAKYKNVLSEHIEVLCPDYEAIDRIDPKDHFAITTEELGVSSLKTWIIESEEGLNNVKKSLPYPVFIKPPNDVGGRGISKVDNAQELSKAYAILAKKYTGQKILVQEMAEGEDYCYCALYEEGKRIASMVYTNIQKFPHDSGAGVIRKTVDAKPFDDIATALIKPLRWNGVVEIDFMWDGDGRKKPKMIEVNPRFWAGLDHSIRSNVDFPWILYALHTDKRRVGKNLAVIGKTTKVPTISTLGNISETLDEAIHFDKMQKQWPTIKSKLDKHEYGSAFQELVKGLKGSVTLSEAYAFYKQMQKDTKAAEKISYSDDDPYVSMGILFILSSLIRDGKLPPEVTR